MKVEAFLAQVRGWHVLSPCALGHFVRFDRLRVSKDGQLWRQLCGYLFTEHLIFVGRVRDHLLTDRPYQLAGCIMLRHHVMVIEGPAEGTLVLRLRMWELPIVHLNFSSNHEALTWRSNVCM